METVLIADDEENIREGIKLIIDWEELGFEIIGDASNGEEALAEILKRNPTLVVMDMQMPKIHGIDVIKRARAQGYEGYFIILSGYSDFSYAKEAIKNRVTNYITKPVDEDELLATVEHIKRDIDQQRKEGGQIVKIRKKAKDVVLRELLQGVYQDDTSAVSADSCSQEFSQEQLEELDSMGISAPCYQVVIHETYHSKDMSSQYQLPTLVKTFLDENSIETCQLEGNDCLLLKGKAAIAAFRRFIEHYDKTLIEEKSPLDMIFMAIGKETTDPAKIALSYESAKSLAGRRFFCEKGQHLITADDIKDDSSAQVNICDLEVFVNQLMGCAVNGNRGTMMDMIENQTQALIESGKERSDVCLWMTEVILKLKDLVHKQYPMMADIFDSHAGIIEFVEGSFYLYEITDDLLDILTKIMNKLHDSAGADNIIENVIEYTDRNYAQQLTLEEIASVYGYNSGYLGRLFNRTMGVGYNYYLNECRIKKAMKLLQEGHVKVYEAAELVGYKDVDYFGKKFRKHAGMTPAEFRKQAQMAEIK